MICLRLNYYLFILKFIFFQLKGQLMTVLLQNLQRLDEKQKEDADGVHNTLG